MLRHSDPPAHVCRLHREALKQAAVDPSTGKIDISILTTGISGAARKQRAERAQAVKALIKDKGRVPTLKYAKLYDEFKERSEVVSANYVLLNNGMLDIRH